MAALLALALALSFAGVLSQVAPAAAATATIPVDAGPFGVAFTPDGTRAYVANAGADTVSVIDTATGTVIATIRGVGSLPYGLAITPDGARSYVVNRNSNTVSVIDTASNTVTGTIHVGREPCVVAVNPDGTRAYVTNLDSDSVSVIDTATNTVIRTIGGASLGFAFGVAFAPDGAHAYVTSLSTNQVSVIDTATSAVTATIGVGSVPTWVAITSDGTRAYVTNVNADTVSVIDTVTRSVIATIGVGDGPCGVAVTPDGTRAYVANERTDTVSVVDTATHTVTATIGVGRSPCVVAVSPGGALAYVTNHFGQSVSVIVINDPPMVSAGGPYAGQEGTSVPVAGLVTDPDGPSGSQTWSIAPGSGVDPGATCVFGDASAVTTSVTCTDDGTYIVTLTATDGLNPPVAASTTVTLSNVAPAVRVTAPADGVVAPAGTSVSFTAPFTDAGTNDRHACTFDFDDGSPIAAGTVTETPGGGTCTTTHTFTVPGTHAVLVTVSDDDIGAGTDVVRVVVNSPPVVSAGGPYSGQEGAAVTIAGSVTDPDGPNLSHTWTTTPGAGVDPGATCVFGDASVASTTVTCTDDGTYTLTLTSTDGLNPPVAVSTTATLFNVAPAVDITAPADGIVVATGAAVSFTAPFTDVGTNDRHTCTLDFADGSPITDGTVTQTPGSGTCASSHPFTTAGTHHVLVTVRDDDGASATDVVEVIVNALPVASAGGPYTGPEGATVPIAGSVTDPDGPSLTTSWLIVPGSGVDPDATCVVGDVSAVSTTVTCTDDGTYTVRLTADDGLNSDVVASATLTVTNAAPAVTISSPASGTLIVRGSAVTVTAPFTDAGRNDSHICTINFADGSPPVTGTVTQTPGSGTGTCATTHAFTALGPYDIVVTVTDDDGATDTATTRVVIFQPGQAWAISTTGPLPTAKTPHAVCPPDAILTQVGLTVPGLANVNALNASCTLDSATGTTHAAASVDSASLLGGAITINTIQASCVAGPDGITGSSRVGTINGIPIGTGPGSINIPLVATVYFNQTVNGPNGQLAQHAVRVVTLLGQEIILAGCHVG